MIGVVSFSCCLNCQSLFTSHNTICADKCGPSLAYLQEMLLLLLPLLNSSSVKKFLGPFSKDKSSSSKVDDDTCPICQAIPTIPFLSLPCQHRYATAFSFALIKSTFKNHFCLTGQGLNNVDHFPPNFFTHCMRKAQGIIMISPSL